MAAGVVRVVRLPLLRPVEVVVEWLAPVAMPRHQPAERRALMAAWQVRAGTQLLTTAPVAVGGLGVLTLAQPAPSVRKHLLEPAEAVAVGGKQRPPPIVMVERAALTTQFQLLEPQLLRLVRMVVLMRELSLVQRVSLASLAAAEAAAVVVPHTLLPQVTVALVDSPAAVVVAAAHQ